MFSRLARLCYRRLRVEGKASQPVWRKRVCAFSSSRANLSQPVPWVSFSACGWAGAYHIGVATALVRRGLIGLDTKVLGCSGGAMVAAALALGAALTVTMLPETKDCELSEDHINATLHLSR